jgi:hypothetical protein
MHGLFRSFFFLMRRPLGFLANLLGEAVADAVFEGLSRAVLAGPLWIIKHFFGPLRVSDGFAIGLALIAAFLGLVMFAAIGVSRHPEAWKVRLFGALVAGVFAAEALYLFVLRSRHLT